MILALNTSTGTFSAALCGDTGNCVKEISIKPKDGKRANHSELLIVKINALLNGKTPEHAGIKKIICATGPGSFTGIRAGLAFARCLCQYYSMPFAGIKTSEAYVQRAKIYNRHSAMTHASLYCVIISASMNETYVSLFAGGKLQCRPKEIFPCKVLQKEDLKKYIRALKDYRGNLSIVFTGDWVADNLEFLIKAGAAESEIIENNSMCSLAQAAASLAPQIGSRHFSKALPFYVQPPRLR